MSKKGAEKLRVERQKREKFKEYERDFKADGFDVSYSGDGLYGALNPRVPYDTSHMERGDFDVQTIIGDGEDVLSFIDYKGNRVTMLVRGFESLKANESEEFTRLMEAGETDTARSYVESILCTCGCCK